MHITDLSVLQTLDRNWTQEKKDNDANNYVWFPEKEKPKRQQGSAGRIDSNAESSTDVSLDVETGSVEQRKNPHPALSIELCEAQVK